MHVQRQAAAMNREGHICAAEEAMGPQHSDWDCAAGGCMTELTAGVPACYMGVLSTLTCNENASRQRKDEQKVGRRRLPGRHQALVRCSAGGGLLLPLLRPSLAAAAVGERGLRRFSRRAASCPAFSSSWSMRSHPSGSRSLPAVKVKLATEA